MKVKICGLTRLQDALLALKYGATELGFIFAHSPRRISLEQVKNIRTEVPSDARFIGVFMNEKIQTILDIAEKASLQGIQLHGSENPEMIKFLKLKRPDLLIMKTIGVKGSQMLLNPSDYGACDALVFDSAGSHFQIDQRHPIDASIHSTRPFYLAGGLNAQNVLASIKKYKPSGLDLSSGVESSPGIKDEALLKELFFILKDVV